MKEERQKVSDWSQPYKIFMGIIALAISGGILYQLIEIKGQLNQLIELL